MTSISPNSDRFYVLGGTMMPDAPSYVNRRADRELQDHIAAGDYCYVLTSRQMGKSSLMARTAKHLREIGVHASVVDLSAIGTGHDRVSVDQWCQSFVHSVARQLRLSGDLKSWWDERQHLATLARLGEFFGDVLLRQTAGQVVVFVDEIDSTIHLRFKDDFFATIRSCYNARATETEYQRLVFVLLGVASPSDLIQDKTRTPFNVGCRIELTDFTEDEVQLLADGLGQNAKDADRTLTRILYWTGGHPYLTQRICCEVADRQLARFSEEQTDAIVRDTFLSTSAMRDDHNLRFVYDRLMSDDDLEAGSRRHEILQLYWRVIRGTTVTNESLSAACTALKLSGVVAVNADNTLRVRNRIYEQIFTKEWALQALPVDWTGGDSLQRDGNSAGALNAYHETMEIALLRAGQDPGNSGRQRDVSIGYDKIGDVLIEQGEIEAARTAFQRALEIRRQFAKNSPAQSGWWRDLAVSQERIGDLLARAGDVLDARSAYQQALDIRQQLVSDEPDNQGWRSELAACWTRIGKFRQGQGELGLAMDAHRAAFRVLEDLARDYPESTVYARDLARLQKQISEVFAERKEVDELALCKRVTCPHCYHVFPPEDVLWVAMHPNLTGDPRLGSDAPMRFLPSRFDVGGNAIDPKGDSCNALACPNCHLSVPRILLEFPPVFISVLGGPGSGKSYFLASMVWRLRRVLYQSLQIGFSDADSGSNRRLNEYENRLFLNSSPDGVARLPKTELEGDLYESVQFGERKVWYPRPFVFAVQPLPGHPANDNGQNRSRVLCLYDFAGEHFLPGGETVGRPMTQLSRSHALFILFDPTQHPAIRRACGMSDTVSETKPTFHRQEQIVIEAANRLRMHNGLGQRDRLKNRVIVVVTKFDAWQALVGGSITLDDRILRTGPSWSALDIEYINRVSNILRALLLKYAAEFVAAVEGFFVDVCYVPISVVGNAVKFDQASEKIDLAMGNIDPLWTEVPMLLAIQSADRCLIPIVRREPPDRSKETTETAD